MTTIIGFDNSKAGKLLAKYGQQMYLNSTTGAVADPVAGTVTAGVTNQLPLKGYVFPASTDVASYYGISNIEEDDILCFVEALVEPTTEMKLQVNSVIFTIIKVQSINKAGKAVLFVVQARK